MTFKQAILRKIYPLIMQANKSSGGKGTILTNKIGAVPKESFHQLKVKLNTGKVLDFKKLKNKKVLLVNTASNCGFTGQYGELQELHDKYKEKLVIIGFPANDFKDQEKSDDKAIAQFCQLNYGVTFSLSQKSSVVKGPNQNPIYQWLTDPEKNGWNAHQPDWNFSKYLIDENGKLTHYFGPAVSPLGKEIKAALK